MDTKNKNRTEIEKEADYFTTCLLRLKVLLAQKKKDFEKSYSQQHGLSKISENQEIKEQLIEYLSEHFKTSKETMRYRLEQLKVI